MAESPAGLWWADQHCHLRRDTASEQVAEANDAGVDILVTVGTDLESSRLAIEMAGQFDGVWATVGLHPHDAKDGLDGIEELLGSPKVVAVGECGLDYYYEHSPRDTQREVFAAQIAMAHRHGLPLVIHSRDAWDDTFEVLAAEGAPEHTVMHCFTGGPDEARRSLDLGAHLSFSGIVSFPNAPGVREAAALCPADRYLVETDSPYLAPVPHRGRKNRPALLPHVGEAVAEARGATVEVVASQSRATARGFYRLA
ncbi:MAG: TatD family hydrolase [Acidimicrobiales bacterium]|nr:TatD family hydrolase [Acidimicrobiales bacterium]